MSPTSPPLSDLAARQLAELALTVGRPLLMTDADEVQLYFSRHFEDYLGRNGIVADFRSYELLGNLREAASGRVLDRPEIFELVDGFFAAEATRQTPVEGAAEALAELSEIAQIVVLTNVPVAQHVLRQEMLRDFHMDYPVVVNTGLKGPVVRAMACRALAPSAFVDDIDRHHQSVAADSPETFRLHFIADPRLAGMAPRAEHCHHRCDRWPEAATLLLRHLTGHLTRQPDGKRRTGG